MRRRGMGAGPGSPASGAGTFAYPSAANYAAQQGSNIRFLQNGAPIVANMSDIKNFSVTIWNQWEFVTGSLYDSAAYPAAGTNSLSFFQVPVGGGTGFGGATKTASDTNIVLAGNLPSGNMFVISSIEVEFQPATPTVTAGMPAAFGAQAIATSINDAYIFWRSGNLVLRILQKDYAQEAPMMRFPSQADFSLQAAAADVSSTAASLQTRIAYASSYGNAFMLSPNNLLIPETTNFKVTTAWPEGLQAITNPARVFVRLNGMQARQAQ